jgi:hypothetical protein
MSKVRITADKDKNVITVSPNNPDYGWFFVEQTVAQLENGWFKNVTRKARITGKLSDLTESKFEVGQEFPGKIVVLESLTPFNTENPDSDLKIAGKSGVVCRYFDQPIYRQSYFTSNLNSPDELINHTNSDEIKDVIAAQRTMETLTETAEPAL